MDRMRSGPEQAVKPHQTRRDQLSTQDWTTGTKSGWVKTIPERPKSEPTGPDLRVDQNRPDPIPPDETGLRRIKLD